MKGHIENRGSATWRISVFLGRDEKGRQLRRTETVHGTRRDADRRLREILHELDTGTLTDSQHMKVGAYLERWLEHVETRVAPKTLERYAEIVRKHLKPALGYVALAKLQPLHIQDYYGRALTEGRLNRAGGLSPQTVLHHHRVLRSALQQAVRWHLLSANPCDGVEPPRPPHKEMRALDEVQTAELLGLLRGSRLYTPTLVAVTTGLRRGEVLGLRWRDIDMDTGLLHVQRTLQQTKQGVCFRQPKTSRSTRTLQLAHVTVDALRAHKTEQAALRLGLGPAYHDDGLVFPSPDGRPWRPDLFSVMFKQTVERKGMKVRFHDLRHSHASQLLRQGNSVKLVSERLGHSTSTLTLDTYAHILSGMEQAAVDGIDAALGEAIRRSETA